MKRFMLTSLAVAVLSLNYGCAQKAGVSTQSAVQPAGNAIAALKMGKDEGTIDKAFFNKIAAEKPANVSIVDVRTKFEFAAGNFPGSKHISINEIYSEGCPATIGKLPKEGYVVFVCATGARSGEMYFGLKDDCKMDMKRFAFLDAEVAFGPKGPVVK